MNPFQTLLTQPKNGKHPLGTWLMSGTPSTAEAMGHIGFDWLVIDMEHVPMDVTAMQAIHRAVDVTPATAVMRLPWNDAVLIKQVLDAGAHTLMVPMIQNADEAAKAVAACKYPPQGVRGFAAMHRASRYGTDANFVKNANASVSVICQLETPHACSQLEAIAAVPGVDALFLGPGDLAANMGYLGNMMADAVQAQIADVARRCRAINMPCGIVGPTPEAVARFIDYGYTYVAVASDMGMMQRQAKLFLTELAAHTPALNTGVY